MISVSFADRWSEPPPHCNVISLRSNCKLLETGSNGSLIFLAQLLQENPYENVFTSFDRSSSRFLYKLHSREVTGFVSMVSIVTAVLTFLVPMAIFTWKPI